MKKALVTGVTGQDGAYLSKILLEKGYKVYGTFRRVSTPNFWRLQTLNVYSKIHLIPADLLDMGSLLEALKVSDPDEVYNLAASSYVGTSFEQAIGNAEITGLAVTKILEALLHQNSKIKFYQASTSEMYGNNKFKTQNEETPFSPASPYATSKLYAHWITNVYRKSYDIFASCGILFNHESPLRSKEFVTKKIIDISKKIKKTNKGHLYLGNIDIWRDWGWAPEYVNAMWLMMQQKKPIDLVIGSGKKNSIRAFVYEVFKILNIKKNRLRSNTKKFKREIDIKSYKANTSLAKKTIKWSAKISFKQIVYKMIKNELF